MAGVALGYQPIRIGRCHTPAGEPRQTGLRLAAIRSRRVRSGLRCAGLVLSGPRLICRRVCAILRWLGSGSALAWRTDDGPPLVVLRFGLLTGRRALARAEAAPSRSGLTPRLRRLRRLCLPRGIQLSSVGVPARGTAAVASGVPVARAIVAHAIGRGPEAAVTFDGLLQLSCLIGEGLPLSRRHSLGEEALLSRARRNG
jgi:hypothetical protein